MLLSFVLGLSWVGVLVTLLSASIGLAITPMGLPLLVGTLILWTYLARLERARVGALLGVRIRDPYRPLPEGTWWVRVKARVRDPHVWLDLLYLMVLFPIGLAELVIAIGATTVRLLLLGVPFYYRARDGLMPGLTHRIDSLPEAIAVALLGAPYLLTAMGREPGMLARTLLSTSRAAELTARIDQLTASRSRALDASISDRRRIERDLHDGAQQRLVKLAMDLGMAKEKLATDPAARLSRRLPADHPCR